MAPHVSDHVNALPTPIPVPPASRLSLDSSLRRLGILDGGWWPRSRNAGSELPGLVSSLNARVGVILRLSVDARDWDDIPYRITVGGHVVRVGRFASMNHQIIVTRGPQDDLMLLVVPPKASTTSAEAALAMAANGKNGDGPEEILAATGNGARVNLPAAGDGDRAPRPGFPSAVAEAVRIVVIEDTLRAEQGEIGRWFDDGAPPPSLRPAHPN
jgi:hypothetical protein